MFPLHLSSVPQRVVNSKSAQLEARVSATHHPSGIQVVHVYLLPLSSVHQHAAKVKSIQLRGNANADPH